MGNLTEVVDSLAFSEIVHIINSSYRSEMWAEAPVTPEVRLSLFYLAFF